jgi:NADH dehydrogenase
VQANVRFPASVQAACEGAFAVINLPSVLYSSGAQSFDALNVFGSDAVAKAARAAKAPMLIHMSAIGADSSSKSRYAVTNAEGEANARAAYPNAIILRPSVVFGPEDHFFNKFALMARFSPVLPMIGAETKFQPVFVGDIAEAVAVLVDRGVADGKTYELGGPLTMTMRQVLDFVLATVQRKRLKANLPFGLASLIGAVAGLLPKPQITTDQVELLKSDNVVSEAAQKEGRTLQGLGLKPRSVEAIVPSYLYRYRKAGQFTTPSVMPE